MITLALTEDRINAQGGLTIIGKLVQRFCGLRSRFAAPADKRADRLSDADILTAQIGLLAQGRSHYDDIELFRNAADARDESFAQSLGLMQVPSEPVMRQRLKALAGDAAVAAQLAADGLALIKAHGVRALPVQGRAYVPVDVDVTPFDNSRSHRENLGRTYKGTDGFAPIMAYIGAQGWLLHHELRPGTQHCQKGTPEFLQQCLERIGALELKHQALLRMDSGNDSADNIALLRASEHAFIIKRNLRKENPVKWLSHAMAQGKPECPRPGKEVYVGTCEHYCPGGEESTQAPLPIVYRVVRRSIDKHGQPLLIDELSVETYWTNLGEAPQDIIELYHDHGTSEQYHSELKSDLNLERFPSQSYAVNTLILQLGALAYNLLRALDERARQERSEWPQRIKPVERRRVGSIIRDLIQVACKWVRHSGRELMKLASDWPWSRVLVAIDTRLNQ